MKTLKIAGIIAVIGVALVFIWRSLRSQPPDELLLPAIGMGQMLADEVVRELPSASGRVVVLCRAATSAQDQATLEAFRKALRQHKQLTISLKTVPNEDVGVMEYISLQTFAEATRTAPADVIVTFFQVKSFADASAAQLPQPFPKLIAVRWDMRDLLRGMQSGRVSAGVATRILSSLPTGHPKNPREWFDRYYELVTPQTATALQ